MKTQIRHNPIHKITAAFLVLGASAFAVEAPVAGDSYVDSGVPTTNYGTSDNLRVYQLTTRSMRSLIKFDLGVESLPPNRTISHVSQGMLRLWLNTTTTIIGDFKVVKLTSDFNELTIKNTMPVGSTFPTQSSAPADTVNVSMTGVIKENYLEIPLPAQWIKDWLADTSTNRTNFGIILIPVAASTNLFFDSKESGATSNGPKLEIHYASPGRIAPKGDLSMGTFTNGPTP